MGKWETIRLSDVCHINPPSPKGLEIDKDYAVIPMDAVTTEGKVNYINWVAKSQVGKGLTPFCQGDLLFAKITPCMENGKCAVVPPLKSIYGFGSTEFHVIRVGGNVDVKWLFHLIHSEAFRYEAKRHMTGSAGQKRVPARFLLNFQTPLPPLEVQRKIADVLDRAAALIEKRKAQIEKLDLLVKSRFVEMFGDPEFNPKQLPCPPIKEVARLQGGYAFKSADYIKDGIKLVQISNVHKDTLNWDEVNYVPMSYYEEFKQFALVDGDIVMAMTRPIIKSLNAVKVAMFSHNDGKCLLNQRVGRFLIDENITDRMYFLHFLCTQYFKRKVEKMASVSLQPNISSRQIEDIQILKPPLFMQRKFSAFLQQISDLRTHSKRSVNLLTRYYDSLVQKCFRGDISTL